MSTDLEFTEFTMANIEYAAAIMRAAAKGSRVKWMPDEDAAIREGVARSLGDEQGNHGGAGTRPFGELFLRVTSTTGFDYFMPTVDVMQRMRAGMLYFED